MIFGEEDGFVSSSVVQIKHKSIFLAVSCTLKHKYMLCTLEHSLLLVFAAFYVFIDLMNIIFKIWILNKYFWDEINPNNLKT